jgi:hypothetical protein
MSHPAHQPDLDGYPTIQETDATDRASLIQVCVYLRDRMTSVALADRLDRALAEVGVRLLDPTGQPFDPAWHEAGGTVPTTDDNRVGLVAAVEAPGYADRGVLLRPPVVTVYQRGPQWPSAASEPKNSEPGSVGPRRSEDPV